MIFKFNEEVADALANKKPIVALESTVIAHGLPFPKNLETARSLEKIVRANGAVPATIAVFDGDFYVGLNQNHWSCDRGASNGDFFGCLTHPRLNRIGKLIK